MTDQGQTRTNRHDVTVAGSSSDVAGTSDGRPAARRSWVTPTVEDAGVWSVTAGKHSVPQEGVGAESAKDGS